MNTLTVKKAPKIELVHTPEEGDYYQSDIGGIYILTHANRWLAINIRTGNSWNFPESEAKEAVGGLTYVGPVDITIETR